MKKTLTFLGLFFVLSIYNAGILKASEIVNVDFKTPDCGEFYCVNEGQNLEGTFNVDQSGDYNLHIELVNNENLVIQDNVTITIDDTQYQSETLLKRYSYDNDGIYETDRYNNEVLPSQVVLTDTNDYVLKDTTGIEPNYDIFSLESGSHTFSIKSNTSDIKIKSVYFTSVDDFKVDTSGANSEVVNGDAIIIEGENFAYKNNIRINAKPEISAKVTPNSSKNKVINTIDPKTFDTGGYSITYEVMIENSGYYDLYIRGLNDDSSGIPMFLNIYVNGNLQSEELSNVAIPSSNDYETAQVPTPLYLNEGTNYITIEISIAPYNEILENLRLVNQSVTNLSSDITQITGGVIDENRDWQMTTFMPNLVSDLEEIRDSLVAIKEQLLVLSGGKESEYTNSIDLMIRNIDELLSNPDNVPNNMELLSTGTTSVLAMGTDLETQLTIHPYGIDKLFLVPSGTQLDEDNVNVFESIGFDTMVFINSFIPQTEKDMEYDTEIEVWIKRPRQYVDMMQKMADEMFTPVSGIKVNMSVMTDQNKITMANAAGEQPDIVMGIDSWYAYELGLRGAFADVNEFEQTSQITSTMAYGGMIPQTIGDQMYMIPETQDFYVMYYRNDIFDAYGFEVPDTWGETVELLPELQANGMNMYLPFSGGSSLKSYSSTYPFFLMNDVSIYSEDGMTANIDTPEAQQSIQWMTDAFTIYGLPLNVPNFYDSFRTGTIPIGVANFSTYIQLSFAAPELAGKWSVAPVPGRVVDGEVVRYMTGPQTGASIFEKSENKEESMEFLAWWMSTETQVEFQQRLIATYGPEYMWNSANVEALVELPISDDDALVFADAFMWIEEPPKTPGGYYLERGISDIWNAVVFEGENVRSATNDQIDVINNELYRKYQEFGYIDEDGNIIEPYVIPTGESIEQQQTK